FSGTTSSSSTTKPKSCSSQVTSSSTPIESMTPDSSRLRSAAGASPGMAGGKFSSMKLRTWASYWLTAASIEGSSQGERKPRRLAADSPRTASEKHDLDGLQQDQEIEQQAMVLDVEQVELQLLVCVCGGCAIGIAELRPPGQARLHRVAHAVVADFVVELVDKLRALGPRADKAHVAGQHVEQLRQFVQAGLADEAAHTGGPVIVAARPLRNAILLGIGAHAAELRQLEAAAALAHPDLPVQRRSAIFQAYRQRNQEHRGPAHHQQHQRRGQVESALAEPAHDGVVEATREHQRRWVHDLELDHARLALEERRQLDHRNPPLRTGQDVFSRQANATLIRRHHDLVHAQALDQDG